MDEVGIDGMTVSVAKSLDEEPAGDAIVVVDDNTTSRTTSGWCLMQWGTILKDKSRQKSLELGCASSSAYHRVSR